MNSVRGGFQNQYMFLPRGSWFPLGKVFHGIVHPVPCLNGIEVELLWGFSEDRWPLPER